MGSRNGSRNWKDIVELPILVFAGNEVKGSWIQTQCIICFKNLTYWSKAGVPLTRYKFPRCDVHK